MAIKFWKETDFQVVNGITNLFKLDPSANLVQILNRQDGGGGDVFGDNRSNVSTTGYAIKIEQGKTGNIVRPYPLQNLYLVTDAPSPITVTIIQAQVDDLGVVFNASQVLQIQGSVQVSQPVSINDLNTEVAEGAANPSKAFLVAGTDGTDAHYLQMDASKNLKVVPQGTASVNQVGSSLGKSGTAAANTAATVTINGVAGKQTIIRSIHFGFSGASPAAPVQATIADGTSTHYFAVPAQGVNYDYNKGVAYTSGANVTITLPAGGAGAIGSIMVEYDQI